MQDPNGTSACDVMQMKGMAQDGGCVRNVRMYAPGVIGREGYICMYRG